MTEIIVTTSFLTLDLTRPTLLVAKTRHKSPKYRFLSGFLAVYWFPEVDAFSKTNKLSKVYAPVLFAKTVMRNYWVTHAAVIVTSVTDLGWLSNWVLSALTLSMPNYISVLQVSNNSVKYLLWNSMSKSLATLSYTNDVTSPTSFFDAVKQSREKNLKNCELRFTGLSAARNNKFSDCSVKKLKADIWIASRLFLRRQYCGHNSVMSLQNIKMRNTLFTSKLYVLDRLFPDYK